MKKPFLPHDLPIENLNWKKLAPLIGRANGELARYDGLLQTMLNPSLLLSPLTTNEAVTSSRIEGTEATLGEVLQYEAGEKFDKEKTTDIQEVRNYRQSLLEAENTLLQGRFITLSLIKGLHQILMQGVRGHNKSPGQFRNDQNWIGPKNCTIEEASFIPPEPLILQQCLDNLEKYINIEDGDVISQLAIIHAQFEIIHPFKDGNGRIGRILIPLFLFQRKALYRPMFYLSEYLELHRDEYCDRLTNISQNNDWQGWLVFFLSAVEQQAQNNIHKAKKIFDLYKNLKKTFVEVTKSQFALNALDTLFANPIISTSEFITRSGITQRTTVNTILSQLEQASILKKLRAGTGRAPTIYAFPELLNIAEGKQFL